MIILIFKIRSLFYSQFSKLTLKSYVGISLWVTGARIIVDVFISMLTHCWCCYRNWYG